MNRSTLRFAAAAVAAGITLVPVAQAQSTPNTGEQLAVQAAKKGPAELRRFIERTRMVYGLSYADFQKYL